MIAEKRQSRIRWKLLWNDSHPYFLQLRKKKLLSVFSRKYCVGKCGKMNRYSLHVPFCFRLMLLLMVDFCYFCITERPFHYQMWPKAKFDKKNLKFHFVKFWKKVAPCESTDRQVSFEWSPHRISSTDSKVRATLQNSIIHSGSERVIDVQCILFVLKGTAMTVHPPQTVMDGRKLVFVIILIIWVH